MKALAIALLLAAPLAAGLSKSERHLQAGLKLLDKGRAQDALKELGVASALEPERAEIKAAMERAEAALRGGAAPAVQSGPTPAPAASPEAAASAAPAAAAEKAAGALKEAREAYRLSDLDRAREAWNRALQLDAGSHEAHAGLARVAEEAYKADKDAPFDAAVRELYEAALREARKERLVEAKAKLDEARALNPAQAQVLALLARIESGAFAQAGGREAQALLRQADQAMERGDWAAARKALGEAAQAAPGGGRVAAALERQRRAAEPELRKLLARAGRAGANRAGLYRQALALAPDSPEALEGLKRAEADLQRQDGAAQFRARVNALYNEGVEAWQAGRLSDAAARFKAALELDPADTEAAKALEKVRQKLARQSEQDSGDAQELARAAKELEARGRLAQALELYERAASRDPQNAEARAAVERLKKETQGE